MLAFEVLDSKIANRLRTGSYWNLQKNKLPQKQERHKHNEDS